MIEIHLLSVDDIFQHFIGVIPGICFFKIFIDFGLVPYSSSSVLKQSLVLAWFEDDWQSWYTFAYFVNDQLIILLKFSMFQCVGAMVFFRRPVTSQVGSNYTFNFFFSVDQEYRVKNRGKDRWTVILDKLCNFSLCSIGNTACVS